MPHRAIMEVNKYMNNTITAFEHKLEKEYQDQIEAGDMLQEKCIQWQQDFEVALEKLGINTKHGDASFTECLSDIDSIVDSIKEYYRPDYEGRQGR